MLIGAVAPLVEEPFKALFLFHLVRRPTFTYFVDGAIYGFAIGIGFAICESYIYLVSVPLLRQRNTAPRRGGLPP